MTRALLALAAAVVAALVAAPATQAAGTARCRTDTVRVVAGTPTTLLLDCRARSRGRWRAVALGTRGEARRSLLAAPAVGQLGGLHARRGTVRFRAPRTYAGTLRLRYALRLRDGRRARAALRIVVRRARTTAQPGHDHGHGDHPATGAPASTVPVPAETTTAPAATTPTPPVDEPVDDGLPPRVPVAPASVSYSTRAWTPSVQDTCPREVHDRFAVIGPDGVKYPTWHPPTVVDPATGRRCAFGHEHGRDPSGSDLYRWVVDRLAFPGRERYAGLPFGLATEALETWSARSGVPPEHQHKRSEDHVGYKVEYQDDVALVGRDGAPTGVSCDVLVQFHQGSHSADALSNNVHEVLYAARCGDGTELLVSTVGRFGKAGEYTPSCRPNDRVASTDGGYPAGTGFRSIPDRACVERDVLVPPGRTTSAWALYEKWGLSSALEAPGGGTLASFDAAFGVFNPSRYAAGSAGAPAIGRTVALCWETLGSGRRASGGDCDRATLDGARTTPLAFDAADSPFDGTYRDLYLGDVRVANAGGPPTWWTDPYGGHAATSPFPGALRQHVAAVRTAGSPAGEQVFGRERRAPATGVHAPN